MWNIYAATFWIILIYQCDVFGFFSSILFFLFHGLSEFPEEEIVLRNQRSLKYVFSFTSKKIPESSCCGSVPGSWKRSGWKSHVKLGVSYTSMRLHESDQKMSIHEQVKSLLSRKNQRTHTPWYNQSNRQQPKWLIRTACLKVFSLRPLPSELNCAQMSELIVWLTIHFIRAFSMQCHICGCALEYQSLWRFHNCSYEIIFP